MRLRVRGAPPAGEVADVLIHNLSPTGLSSKAPRDSRSATRSSWSCLRRPRALRRWSGPAGIFRVRVRSPAACRGA
jgi:hypothetical protein